MSTNFLNCVSILFSRQERTCLLVLFNVNPCHTVIHGDFQLYALASIVL